MDAIPESKANTVHTAKLKPRRRWLRFSLRTFFVLITIFGVWLGIKVNAARRQHEAVQVILRAGGSVVYDYQFKQVAGMPVDAAFSRAPDPNAEPIYPSWFRNIVGNDFLFDVVCVSLADNSEIAETDLAAIANFPRLWRLTIGNILVCTSSRMVRPLDDFDLRFLGQLRDLHQLNVSKNRAITGRSFESLINSKHLTVLEANNTSVDDSALAFVEKLSNLEKLSLNATAVTDKGLEQLSRLPKLGMLLRFDNNISDAGLVQLGKLPKLETLAIRGGNITDAGLEPLTHLRLLLIYLLQTHVDDRGLETLKKIPSLQFVGLEGSAVTPAGVKSLQAALPGAKNITGP